MSNIMRRSVKRSKKEKSECYVELLKDAGPIPKGRYKVIEQGEVGFICECGSKIVFGMKDIPQGYCTILRKHEISKLTTVEEFAVSYWSNLREMANKPIWHALMAKPNTFCMMDPSLEFYDDGLH